MKLRKRIFSMLLAVFLILSAAGCQSQTVEQALIYWSREENDSVYVLENEVLRLKLDGMTSYFTLTDKRTGEEWTSTPPDSTEDALADPSTRYRMQSTILLTFSDKTGNTVTYDNFRYSIQEGTFRVTAEKDALRVDYMIGPNERVYVVPEVVSEARMEALLEQMSAENRSLVLRTYLKLDPERLKQDRLKELTPLLPQLEAGTVYALPNAAGGSAPQGYQMEQLEEIFASIGYTKEDMEQDSAGQKKESTQIQFNVSLRYSLEEDSLVAQVPEEDISYPAEYPVTELCLLPWFCAAQEGAEGYLLVPDGGGAQIFFHNGKTSQNAYYANVYGWDEAHSRPTRIQDTSAAFPVFGIARDGSYLMAVVGDGAGALSVEADVGGKRSSYDVVRPVFTVVHGEDTSVSAKSKNTVRIFQKDPPSENLTVRYFCGNSDSYVDMAVRYRQYLEQTYPGFGASREEGYPLVLGMIGAMDKTEKIAGVPVRVTTPAVDYREAADLVSRLAYADNLRVQYSAVLNGGLDQRALLRSRRISGLGSEKERQAFLAAVDAAEATLFLGAYTQQVANSSGFSALKNAIRDTTDVTVSRYPYLPVTQTEEKGSENRIYLLNAAAQRTSTSVLAREAAQWNNAGPGYLDLGNLLYSDFNRNHGTSRDEFLRLQSGILAEQKAAGQRIMVAGGNEYAAVYADCVVSMDLEGSAYDITDRQIPFYQIALHGSVAYTGGALNTAADEELRLLRSVETGAGLYYCFFETDYQELIYNRYTVFENLYSANFSDREEEIRSLYERLNAELGHTVSLRITDHRYLTDCVTRTDYADGTRVYVNYGLQSCTVEGVTVPARDWWVKRGG